MVKAKVFIFEKQFDGFPKENDLKLIEEELPPIQDGEFLAEAVYLSVDPYMRAYAPRLPLGKTFVGSQVAKVVESKNPRFEVGKYVVGQFGWRTHTINDGKAVVLGFPATFLLPDLGNLPLSHGLGVLGMPGSCLYYQLSLNRFQNEQLNDVVVVRNTAYFGFLEIINPKPGETVIVTGAGGAVGSLVGQIAKIKGCTVIGVVGSDEKGKWIVDELGFDHSINYKTADLNKAIPEIAPKGIDCYFDNVGGEISSTILNHMNQFGRISVCGCVSGYNEREAPKASLVQSPMIFRNLKMQGFHVSRWFDRWTEGIQQNKKWIEEGKLKPRETVTEGFENMFNAFVDMLQGGNYGKAVVKV